MPPEAIANFWTWQAPQVCGMFAWATFDLGSLGTTDVRSDDFADCFNFKLSPRTFTPIAAPLGRRYFLSEGAGNESPDDDN